jgi:WD40 repeat protein
LSPSWYWTLLFLAVSGSSAGLERWAAAESIADAGAHKTDQPKQVTALPAGKEPLVVKLEDSVLAAAFSPDGRWLAVGSGRHVLVYEAATWRRVHELKGHEKIVLSLAFSRDGRYLASGCMDHTVKLWDPVTGKNLHTLKDHTYDVATVAFSADGKQLVAVAGRHMWMVIPKSAPVKVWEVASGRLVRTVNIPAYLISAVALSPDGQYVAGINLDAAVAVREVKTGRLLRVLLGVRKAPPGAKDPEDSRRATGVAFAPDGQSLAVCDGFGKLTVWNFRTGAKILTRQEPIHLGFGLRGLESQLIYSADGKRLALARRWHYEGPEARVLQLHDLLVWDLAAQTKALSLPVTDTVTALAFHPDGQRLAVGQIYGPLRIWRLSKRQ